MESRPGLRASEADREQAARSLAGHLVAGRLDADELSERLEQAYRAVTISELDELLSDLPGSQVAPIRAVGASSESARRPGHAPFNLRFEIDLPPETVLRNASRTMVPYLLQYGYELERNTSSHLLLTRRYRPIWTIVVAVVAVPVGLLALLRRLHSQLVITASPVAGGGTALDVYGVAPAAVRKAFLELREP